MCFVCFNALESVDEIASKSKQPISHFLFDKTAHTRALRVCETCLERVHFHTSNRGNLGNMCQPQIFHKKTEDQELQGDFLFYNNETHPKFDGQQCLRCHAPGRAMPSYGNP